MSFDRNLAEIRFGCGLSPEISAPGSVAHILDRLQAPDRAAIAYPIAAFANVFGQTQKLLELKQIKRKNKGSTRARLVDEEIVELRKSARREQQVWFCQQMQRRISTNDGLRERLNFFWADHFTARGKSGLLNHANAAYVESSIRPYLTGKFRVLLKAAVTSPLMLLYLDQTASAGPNSDRAKKRPNAGLNENLARELLELHTLGVAGPYKQADVRELAKLLAGLHVKPSGVSAFRGSYAEPGSKTVLDLTYGSRRPEMADIDQVLTDLARHPATARHIATKLARHFVSDQPAAGLIEQMTARFLETDGHLIAVYESMLTHPEAWSEQSPNIKQPIDFVGSALRALLPPSQPRHKNRQFRISRHMFVPLALMGQTWEAPEGPDGWPEDDAAWLTPQGLATRLQWAMSVPQLLCTDLPDPRDFVHSALGKRAPRAVHFAAHAAESRAEGIGLVLASPAFQRL